VFLDTIGEGRKALLFPKKQTVFAQGDPADAIFYLQNGKIRLTVVSKTSKEATIGILSEGSFFGEGSLAGQPLRMGTATAMTTTSFSTTRGRRHSSCGTKALQVVHGRDTRFSTPSRRLAPNAW
jgi:Cyclic nucleotide-binding domain